MLWDPAESATISTLTSDVYEFRSRAKKTYFYNEEELIIMPHHPVLRPPPRALSSMITSHYLIPSGTRCSAIYKQLHPLRRPQCYLDFQLAVHRRGVEILTKWVSECCFASDEAIALRKLKFGTEANPAVDLVLIISVTKNPSQSPNENDSVAKAKPQLARKESMPPRITDQMNGAGINEAHDLFDNAEDGRMAVELESG
ncbi:hypothetical protein PAXRUDRAFT_11460 [Paxillus rubicundulus Ve08.2h10]|uniref:Uncharacterized protein n=1 Tax=Paxillus rubicundulus Ve08.2h10 TaxID=930991 RepID=A0A0D0E937_9AGAM|nr:hypothetical protein PAXRUDRAFT_11460 [Paxillus rubicundulus Ve08.2h10]